MVASVYSEDGTKLCSESEGKELEVVPPASCAGKVQIANLDFVAELDQGDTVLGMLTVANTSGQAWNVEATVHATGPTETHESLRTTLTASLYPSEARVVGNQDYKFHPRLVLRDDLAVGTYEVHATLRNGEGPQNEICHATTGVEAFQSPTFVVKDVTPPPVPEPSAPYDWKGFTSDQTVTLEWVGHPDPEGTGLRYETQVSSTRSFAVRDIVRSAQPWNEGYTVSPALDEGTYFWRVRAEDLASPPNFSDWSRHRRFTVESPEQASTVNLGITDVESPPEFPVPGGHLVVEVDLRNYGDAESGRYNLEVFFSAFVVWTRAPARLARESDLRALNRGVNSSIPAGGRRTVRTEIFVPELKTGQYRLCVEIQYVALTEDSDDSDNYLCETVSVFPQMGEDFPEPLVPMQFKSLYVTGNASEGVTLHSEEFPYWIYAPVNYVSKESIREINDGIFSPLRLKGQGRRVDRIERYRRLALEIAVKTVKQDEILHFHPVAETISSANEIAGMGIEVAKAYEHLVGNANLLNKHLRFLHDHGLFDGVAIGTPIFNTLFSAAFNRTIELEQAHITLDMLRDLQMDSAWYAAVLEAREDLDEMTSEKFMLRWKNEVEAHLGEIASVISKVVVTKLATKAALVGAKLVLGHAVVASAPISLTVGIAVAVAYFIIEETNNFWEHLIQATIAAQVYTHLYSHHFDHDVKMEVRNRTLRYTKFSFYQHLHEAAENWVLKFNVGDNQPSDHKETIYNLRDLALKDIVDVPWLLERDITKYHFTGPLTDKRKPRSLWSNGETMWWLGEGSLFAYNMGNPEWGSYKYRIVYDSRDDIDPFFESMWSDGDTIWFLNYRHGRFNWAYDLYTKDAVNEKWFDIDEIQNSISQGYLHVKTLWLLSPFHKAIYGYEMNDEMSDILPSTERSFELAPENDSPGGIWTDGETLWVADARDHMIYAYNLISELRDPTKEFPILNTAISLDNGSPSGLWSDGETMWVADKVANRIFTYQMPEGVLSPGQTPGPTEESKPPEGEHRDRLALISLYFATKGPVRRNKGNWLSRKELDEWYGVETDTAGNVTSVVLSGNGLRGSIPKEFAFLTELSTLRLSGNQLTGCVPDALRQVPDSDLSGLNLSYCGS